MKPLADRIRAWGSAMHPLSIIIFIVALFTFWTLTLNAFDSFFQEVSAGQPLLDLQNRSNILSPEAALNLICTYNTEARSLYWSFFIMDNAVPLVVFGSLSLLWVNLLKRQPQALSHNLLNSSFILLPLGVGLFDIAENICFVTAVSAPQALNALTLVTIGLNFVKLKAICLFGSFIITGIMLVWHTVNTIRLVLLRRTQNQQ